MLEVGAVSAVKYNLCVCVWEVGAVGAAKYNLCMSVYVGSGCCKC